MRNGLWTTAVVVAVWACAVDSFSPHTKSLAPARRSVLNVVSQSPQTEEEKARTEQMMKKMGYRFDETRKTWVKGSRSRRDSECRSGGRTLAIVSDSDPAEPAQCPSSVVDALREFEETMRTAREEKLSAFVEARSSPSFQAKAFAAQPWAPLCWLGLQLAAAAIVVSSVGTGSLPFPMETDLDLGLNLGLGFGAAPAAILLRRWRESIHPGIEDGRDTLERTLADGQCGSHAIPAPWEWRSETVKWRGAVFGMELVTALNRALVWQVLVQTTLKQDFIGGLMDPAERALGSTPSGEVAALAGVGAVIATAYFTAAYENLFQAASLNDAIELAGATAENEAAAVLAAGNAAADEDEAGRTQKRLAAVWLHKFGGIEAAPSKLRQLTVLSSTLSAVLYFAGGESLVAPLIATAAASLDQAVFPDKDRSRVAVPIGRLLG